MKRTIVALMIVAVAATAYAGRLFTAGNTTGYAVLPPAGGYPVITAINFTATNGTGDLTVYEGDDTEALCVAGKAASATTFVLDSCTGIDDTDVVVIVQRHAASVMEAATVSSCNDTTELITLGAGTANAYNGTRGFVFYEMRALTTWADVGTDAVSRTGDLWGGSLRNKPIAATLTAGTINYMSGEMR